MAVKTETVRKYLVRQKEPVKISVIAKAVRGDTADVRKALYELLEDGGVRKTGVRGGTRWAA